MSGSQNSTTRSADELPPSEVPPSRSFDGRAHALLGVAILSWKQPRACRWCAIVFTPTTASGRRQRFCGTKCSARWQFDPAQGRYRVPEENSQCASCGTRVRRRPITSRPAKYCSRKCTAAGRRKSLLERFWPKVEQSAGCWIWTGARDAKGYGLMGGGSRQQGRSQRAHRLSWEIHNGPIPHGLHVLHDCPDGDNPSCVNPAHLWLGTELDNARDREAKGRGNHATGERHSSKTRPDSVSRGERNAFAKLTDLKVIEMRSLRSAGWKLSQLSSRYSVSEQVVSRACIGKGWSHVKGGIQMAKTRGRLEAITGGPDETFHVRLVAGNSKILMHSEQLTGGRVERARAAIIRAMIDVLEDSGRVVLTPEELGVIVDKAQDFGRHESHRENAKAAMGVTKAEEAGR